MQIKIYLLGGRVEPVANIGASSEHDRVALWHGVVFVDQQSQIINLVEKRDPNISISVVQSDLFWSVESAQLVRTRDVLRVIDAGGSRLTGRWDPSPHRLGWCCCLCHLILFFVCSFELIRVITA